MAKYRTFDEYVKGERIVRYTEWFKKCWDFATEAAEENGSSHNKQSTPLCSCGKPASFLSCDECFDKYIPHP